MGCRQCGGDFEFMNLSLTDAEPEAKKIS